MYAVELLPEVYGSVRQLTREMTDADFCAGKPRPTQEDPSVIPSTDLQVGVRMR